MAIDNPPPPPIKVEQPGKASRGHIADMRAAFARKTPQTEQDRAEATAFIVASRFGLKGASARYVSRYLGNNPMPLSVPLDLVAKVAGRLERMSKEIMKPRRDKKARGQKASE